MTWRTLSFFLALCLQLLLFSECKAGQCAVVDFQTGKVSNAIEEFRAAKTSSYQDSSVQCRWTVVFSLSYEWRFSHDISEIYLKEYVPDFSYALRAKLPYEYGKKYYYLVSYPSPCTTQQQEEKETLQANLVFFSSKCKEKAVTDDVCDSGVWVPRDWKGDFCGKLSSSSDSSSIITTSPTTFEATATATKVPSTTMPSGPPPETTSDSQTLSPTMIATTTSTTSAATPEFQVETTSKPSPTAVTTSDDDLTTSSTPESTPVTTNIEDTFWTSATTTVVPTIVSTTLWSTETHDPTTATTMTSPPSMFTTTSEISDNGEESIDCVDIDFPPGGEFDSAVINFTAVKTEPERICSWIITFTVEEPWRSSSFISTISIRDLTFGAFDIPFQQGLASYEVEIRPQKKRCTMDTLQAHIVFWSDACQVQSTTIEFCEDGTFVPEEERFTVFCTKEEEEREEMSTTTQVPTAIQTSFETSILVPTIETTKEAQTLFPTSTADNEDTTTTQTPSTTATMQQSDDRSISSGTTDDTSVYWGHCTTFNKLLLDDGENNDGPFLVDPFAVREVVEYGNCRWTFALLLSRAFAQQPELDALAFEGAAFGQVLMPFGRSQQYYEAQVVLRAETCFSPKTSLGFGVSFWDFDGCQKLDGSEYCGDGGEEKEASDGSIKIYCQKQHHHQPIIHHIRGSK